VTLPARAAAVVALLVAALPAGAAQGVRVEPVPAWVEVQPVPPAIAAEDASHDGVAWLLVDDQLRLGPGGVEHYNRTVQQVVAPAGTSEASELRVTFDPTYQAVALHEVWVVRGGVRLRALRPAEVKLVQREEELDKQIYDGRVTAVLFLHDVRVGDVVDASWTVRGRNPVFGGKLAGGYDLGWGVPASRVHLRLLHPEARPLAWRVRGMALEPVRTARGGWVDLRFTRAPAPAVAEEEDVPPGTDPFPWLEVSEWPTWEAVARWALPLYQPGPLDGPEIAARLAGWRALPTEEARARAALRFVQDEVRYLGIELGAGSHRPTPPREVLARRFGDCKDKSLLLVSLLRALGLEAAPALVDTEERGAIAGRLPSPAAFDHVVVRARVEGAVRWLEPTRALERAPIEAITPPPYGLALVVAEGTTTLEALPAPEAVPVEVTSSWQVARWGEPVAFEVVTRYRGLAALAMRETLATTPVAELERRYLDHYAHDEPAVERGGPLGIEDAPDADRVTLTERYRLPPVSEGAERSFQAEAIWGHLKLPRTALRSQPLAIRHPVLIRERLQVELPGPPNVNPDRSELTSPAARLVRTGRADGHRYLVDLEYRSLAPSVAARDVAAHLAKVREMRDVASYALTLETRAPGAPSPRAASGRGLGWTGLGLGLVIVIVVLVLLRGVLAEVPAILRGGPRRWWAGRAARRAWSTRVAPPPVPGESAQAPFQVGSDADVAARAGALSCRCGARHDPAATVTEPIRLGARDLRLVRAACARCGEVTRVFFAVG
jgi:hypothetical protein